VPPNAVVFDREDLSMFHHHGSDPEQPPLVSPGGLSRRDLLRAAAIGVVAASAFPRIAAGTGGEPEGAASRGGKTLLVLGGTSFLGPRVVEAAKARGYTVTLFNRGKTNPGMFPDLEQIHGDRNVSLAPLEGRTWDLVVDTSAYYPRQVRMSAGLLKNASKAYVLVSSISVYTDTSKPRLDEGSPVGKIPDETIEKITEGSYGPLKALCEQAAEKEMPGRVLNVRPGLIVGPGDPTDRFTYWPVRVARGGEVLAPGRPSDPVQFIDVRDLGEWIVHATTAGTRGVFNATGPATPLGIGDLLSACRKASRSEPLSDGPTRSSFQHRRWRPGVICLSGCRPWARHWGQTGSAPPRQSPRISRIGLWRRRFRTLWPGGRRSRKSAGPS
jgi:2'-hydroxyisoflavone reductase